MHVRTRTCTCTSITYMFIHHFFCHPHIFFSVLESPPFELFPSNAILLLQDSSMSILCYCQPNPSFVLSTPLYILHSLLPSLVFSQDVSCNAILFIPTNSRLLFFPHLDFCHPHFAFLPLFPLGKKLRPTDKP